MVPHYLGTEGELSPLRPPWDDYHIEGQWKLRCWAVLRGGGSVENQCRGMLPAAGLTWGLRGAGLQVAGLFANRLHQRVAAPDDVLPLVALHIPHPHADAASFCALGNRERG